MVEEIEKEEEKVEEKKEDQASPKEDVGGEEPANAESVSDTTQDLQEKTSEVDLPVEQEEPRKRFRGQIVVSESDRTVETQTFHHIRIADGSEYDLDDREYNGEVHISYPPHV